MGKFFVEMEEKVSTVVFREACDKALEIFNLEWYLNPIRSSALKDVGKQGLDVVKSGFKIRYCNEHPGKEVRAFCKSCGVFFCEECVMEHIEHNTESLKEFCEREKKNVLGRISLKELVTRLGRRRNEKLKKRNCLIKELKDIEKRLSFREGITGEGMDVVLERELIYLESVSMFLAEMEEKVSTIVFKEACEKVLGLFNLEGEDKRGA